MRLVGKHVIYKSQLAFNLKTGEIFKGDIEAQPENTLDNLKYMPENSDSSIKNALHTVVFSRELSDFNGINKIYKEYFSINEKLLRI